MADKEVIDLVDLEDRIQATKICKIWTKTF